MNNSAITTAPSNNLTIAQSISARFDDDGQNWIDFAGVELEDVLDELTRRESDRLGEKARWELADGSAIVIAGDGWDIEGSTPFSWLSA